MKRIEKAFRKQKKLNELRKDILLGTLGIPLGGLRLVEVPNRKSFVYVQLRNNQNEIIQAYNNRVTPVYGLPVSIQREKSGRYIVLGMDSGRYQNNWNSITPYLPPHGHTHSLAAYNVGGGTDTAFIYAQQFVPLSAAPNTSTGSANAFIATYILENPDGTWVGVGGTGTPNLLQYLPTGGNALMALIYLDRQTGNPGLIINSGSQFANNLTGSLSILPYIPNVPDPFNQIPISAVRLDTGTYNIGWNNLYDVRQFYSPHITGTSSGWGGGTDTIGFAGLYNGAPLGTGTFLNVRSQSTASFTKSGSMFDLFITGSSGIDVYNNGVFIKTASQLALDGNVTVSSSGAFAVANFPITTYFRVGQPVPLLSTTGTYWRVPDGVYASGSLGVFVNGHALISGVDYVEHLYVSGIYQYVAVQMTGSYHLNHYGVPCRPQPHIPTGTVSSLTDSDFVSLLDSDNMQIEDSEG